METKIKFKEYEEENRIIQCTPRIMWPRLTKLKFYMAAI
jgi:hypothetical protein